MKNNKTYKQSGFSLIELLVVVLISAIIAIVAMPALTRKLVANNPDISVLKCVKKEFAADLTSNACSTAINHCLYGKNQACSSLSYLIQNGGAVESVNARKVMAATCDRGGEEACSYMVMSCVKDSNACTGTNNLSHYLSLPYDEGSLARIPIIKYAGAYFNSDNQNILNAVNSNCCNSSRTLACSINGTSVCSWQIGINNYASNYFEVGNAIALDKAGNIYAGGYTSGPLGSVINNDVLIKVDPAGNIIWKKRLILSNGRNSEVRGITIDNSGNIYAVGYAGNGTNADVSVVKLDTNGNILWQVTYNSPTTTGNDDKANEVAVDKNGNVYVVGTTYNTSSDILVMKFDNTGTLLWQKSITRGTYDDYGNSIAIDGNDNVYVAGKTGSNFVVMRMSSSGSIVWTKSFSNATEATGLAIDKKNNIYATGSVPGTDMVLVRLNPDNGAVSWQYTISNQSASSNDYGLGIALDKSNNVYITGYSMVGSMAQLAVVKINKNQTLEWSKVTPSTYGKADAGIGIAVDKSWHVFVTGYATIDSTINNGNMPILKLNWKQSSNDLTLNEVTFNSSALTYSFVTPGLNATTSPTFTSTSFGANSVSAFNTDLFN